MNGATGPADHVRPHIWAEGTNAALQVDASIYPISVAIAAGYRFTDRAFVWLQSADRAEAYCVFLKPKAPSDDLATLAGAFANEMLDQALRHQLEQRFSGLRAIITAQAFAEGNLLETLDKAETSTAEPQD
jgi:His-Xaa-Ser system protein HxsD